jgi:hypothetical protein
MYADFVNVSLRLAKNSPDKPVSFGISGIRENQW